MSRYAHGRSMVAIACCAVFLTSGVGCVLPIPLGIYSVEAKAGGETITFRDENGEPLQADGLLVLHRYHDAVYYLKSKRICTQLITIRKGKATLPKQRTLSLPAFNVVSGFYEGIPDDLRLYPFIPGHYQKEYSKLDEKDIEEDCLRLLPSDLDAAEALSAWDWQFAEIRNPIDPPPARLLQFDVVLEEDDYAQLAGFVKAERAQLLESSGVKIGVQD